VKGKNPFDIQQKGITPISNMLRAATGIVTTYTVDVAVVWVQLTMHNALYSTKVHTVTAYFYHCHRVTSNHRQFLDGHRSWACMVSALSMMICP